MARSTRSEVFSPEEVAIVHCIARTCRRCFLMGDDRFTGKNFDHRKDWIETELKKLAAGFGIDLLSFSILSNHFHLVLRSRPDVVQCWDDTEVARRWLTICPKRKKAPEPSEAELNSIRNDEDKVAEIRRRLSDISWWMRLICQRIAQRANKDEKETGKFWQARYRAIRLCDETAILACAAYVDLNPIRAAMAQSLEGSDYTSVQRRVQAIRDFLANTSGATNVVEGTGSVTKVDSGTMSTNVDIGVTDLSNRTPVPKLSFARDAFLSPVEIDERNGPLGAHASNNGRRCSDKGFLPMPTAKYIELLDWTARQIVPGKRGAIPDDSPKIFERLSITPVVWCELVTNFGKLFNTMAGKPTVIEATRSRVRHHRHHVKWGAREAFAMNA